MAKRSLQTFKKEQLLEDLSTAVSKVLNDPKYSALSLGAEFKEKAVTHFTEQMDTRLRRSKEQAVDRILASVRDKLINAPQFDYKHIVETGDIHFTYAEKPAQYGELCPVCNGKGFRARPYYSTVEKVICHECNGTGKESVF